MPENFNVLLVEDNSGRRKRFSRLLSQCISKFIAANPVITECEAYNDAISKIDGLDFDLIVTDYNIDEDGTGIGIVRHIRKKRKPVDILLYSKDDISDEIKDHASVLSFVDIVDEGDDGKITSHMKIIVNKGMKKFEDPVYFRGTILENFNQMETSMELCIEKYFKIAKPKSRLFRYFIAKNKANTYDMKAKLLGKLVQLHNESNTEKINLTAAQLSNIGQKRNKVAHATAESGKLISTDEEQEPIPITKVELKTILKNIEEYNAKLNTFKDKMK